ncbi:hypothetical protein D3C73_1033500 [compost metagenome]
MHLRGSSLEKPTTAPGKQRVTTEQNGFYSGRPAGVSNVPGGVPGHVQHAQVQVQFGQCHAVAFGQRDIAARQAFPRRTVYGKGRHA